MDTGISIKRKVDLERMLLDRSAKPARLSLSLLEEITNYFSDDHQIGSGGFAVVYKGIVGKGIVAVKKLSRTFDMPAGIKFHKEVECLMKAKHKNIVHFLGYCSESHGITVNYDGKFVMADIRNWLLCFEYVPNGSLNQYITDASQGLQWRERYEIIKGICEGLLHLHENRILHLDLKPGNILIDDYMVPKIADFGLSRCLSKEQTSDLTSNICGSRGYVAPELFRGQVAFSSDIYSLGVIIMEILIGEKGYPEDENVRTENVVRNWMKRLEGSDQWDVQLEQVRVCTKIGIDCMDMDPKKRPMARHIIDRLGKTTSIVETGIGSSSVKHQYSSLEYCKEKISKLLSQYLGRDMKEHAEKEELVEYVGTRREYHCQQEAPGDIVLNRTQRNYLRNGGPMLKNIKCVKLFKKWELKSILKGDNFVGKGRFGEVYEGRVDNVPVAVRKLMSGTLIQKEQFVNEVSIQSKVSHINIVKLMGVCLEVDIPMLVYEFLSNGSLRDILHCRHKLPLDLGVRLSIAAGAANGLAYMHSTDSGNRVLHGDVKPANILLDHNFVPKISDLGISRMIGKDYGQTARIAEHIGRVAGVIAYMDPVYQQTCILSEQSDAYSFGIVILELISRMEATRSHNNSLVRNFLDNHKQGRKSTNLFDKEIAVVGDLEVLDSLAEIAVECLNDDVSRRPRMLEVAKRLDTLNKSRMLTR